MDKHPWIDRVEWEPEYDKPGQQRAFDEIVASNVDIHIERMSDGCYWMGIYPAGSMKKVGISDRQVVTFYTRRGALVVGTTEAE